MTATSHLTDEILKTRARVEVMYMPMSFLGDCSDRHPFRGSSEYEA